LSLLAQEDALAAAPYFDYIIQAMSWLFVSGAFVFWVISH
jgi:hypothetical protein